MQRRQSAWLDKPKILFTRVEAAVELGVRLDELNKLIEDHVVRLAWLNGTECVLRCEIEERKNNARLRIPT